MWEVSYRLVQKVASEKELKTVFGSLGNSGFISPALITKLYSSKLPFLDIVNWLEGQFVISTF